MTENEIARIIVDAAFHIHSKLGPGLLESVYQKVLAQELRARGLELEEERPLPVTWDELKMDVGFRVDLLVNKRRIVELKSIEKIAPVHE